MARARPLRCGVSAGRQRRFVWLGLIGAAPRAVVLCQSSLSSRRVNGHHPWIRITRVICGQIDLLTDQDLQQLGRERGLLLYAMP